MGLESKMADKLSELRRRNKEAKPMTLGFL
jgi:hypothetical protein